MAEDYIVPEVGELFPEGYAFNLSDFGLFLTVMKNKEAYECTVSIILEELDNIFNKDLAKYTFTEQCEEIEGLHLEDRFIS